MHGEVQRLPFSRPVANAPAKLKSFCTELHLMYMRRRGVIGGDNAWISTAILPSAVICQCTECNFRRFTSKIGYHSNIPWAIAKKDGLVMPAHIGTHP